LGRADGASPSENPLIRPPARARSFVAAWFSARGRDFPVRRPDKGEKSMSRASKSGEGPPGGCAEAPGENESPWVSAEAEYCVDFERIERAVRDILHAVGEDPDREGLRETPARVARMYAEMFNGLRADPREHLRKSFIEKYDEVVLVRDISFCSMCEHHLLPFMGKAHIGYMPDGRVVGLSKLARVVEVVSRRPQVQERMTEEIADLLLDELGAKGVAVVVEATHSCMTIRGVRKPGSVCVTSAMKGLFRSNLSSRSEIMQLIYGDRS
jgi:GTP cyclohydrolase I